MTFNPVQEYKDLVKEFEKEVKDFKSNLSTLKKNISGISDKTFDKVNQAFGFLEDLPNLISDQLLKLLGKLGDVLKNIFGEAIILIFKIVFRVIKEIYLFIEKEVPYFYLAKYFLLAYLLLPIFPPFAMLNNMLAVPLGPFVSTTIVFGGLFLGVGFVYMNIGAILKYFAEVIVKMDFINLIENVIEEIGPEIAKLGEKIWKEIEKLVKIF